MDRSGLSSSSARSDGAAKSSGEGSALADKVARLIRKSQPPGMFFVLYMAVGMALAGVQLGIHHHIGPLSATAMAVIAWAVGTEHEAATWRRKLRKALNRSPPRPDATVNDRGRDEPNSTRSEQ